MKVSEVYVGFEVDTIEIRINDSKVRISDYKDNDDMQAVEDFFRGLFPDADITVEEVY